MKMFLMLKNQEITLHTSRFHPQKDLWVYVWKMGPGKKGGGKGGGYSVFNSAIQRRKFTEILDFRSPYAIYTLWTCATNIRNLSHPFHHPFSNRLQVMNHDWEICSIKFMDFWRFLEQPLNFRGQLKFSTTLFTTLFYTIVKFRIWTIFWPTMIIARNAWLLMYRVISEKHIRSGTMYRKYRSPLKMSKKSGRDGSVGIPCDTPKI